MEQRAIKLDFAEKMAEELWERYMQSTEPSKRRIYALRYEFWKGVAEANEPLNTRREPLQGS